ncbi:MAG TPA: hypothetical protein VJB57_19445 [Dehalococcoidia bacterium]|nr:hypothetical protein [Dehalococcoidia bacterium]
MLELLDVAATSDSTGPRTCPTRTPLDTGDYDGATYYFEVVAESVIDTGARTIDLYNSAGSSVAQVSVPALIGSRKRIRSASFTPTAGLDDYRVRLEGTTGINSKLYLDTARIIIAQTGATKTRLSFPLMGANDDKYDGSTVSQTVDDTISTTYTAVAPNFYSIWKKTSASLATLASGSPWRFEACLRSPNALGTAYASLFNKTDNTQVTASEVSTTSTTTVAATAAFADNATNFDNLDSFECRIKTSNAAYRIVISRCALSAALNPATKTESYYRIQRERYFPAEAFTTVTLGRALYDSATFDQPVIYFEGVGYRTFSGALYAHLRDHSTNDSGTNGTNVTSSQQTYNTGAKVLSRSAALTITSGDRFISYLDSDSAPWGSYIICSFLVVAATEAAAAEDTMHAQPALGAGLAA